MQYQLLKYSNDYKSSLLELLSIMWNGLTDEEIIKKFEWRYEQNPAHDQPYIFIAVDNENEVVGFRAFVLQEFCKGSKNIKVFNPADAIVHPDHRRKGLFSKLTNALIEQISDEKRRGVVLNLSSNEKSTPGYLKLGWSRTNGQKRYAYKVSPKYFATKSDLTSFNRSEEVIDRGSVVISYKVEIDQLSLFAKCGEDQPSYFENCRTKEYFYWRYKLAPDRDDYYSAYLKTDRVKAYVVLKRLSEYQFSLEEYDAGSAAELNQLIKKVVDTLKIPILRTWMINKSDHELLSTCGFLRETSLILKLTGKKRLPILIRPTVLQPVAGDFIYDGLDIRDMNNWRIQKADSH